MHNISSCSRFEIVKVMILESCVSVCVRCGTAIKHVWEREEFMKSWGHFPTHSFSLSCRYEPAGEAGANRIVSAAATYWRAVVFPPWKHGLHTSLWEHTASSFSELLMRTVGNKCVCSLSSIQRQSELLGTERIIKAAVEALKSPNATAKLQFTQTALYQVPGEHAPISEQLNYEHGCLINPKLLLCNIITSSKVMFMVEVRACVHVLLSANSTAQNVLNEFR